MVPRAIRGPLFAAALSLLVFLAMQCAATGTDASPSTEPAVSTQSAHLTSPLDAGDRASLLTSKLTAGCSLIWPRMGEEYVYPSKVFVQYMCEIRGLERGELVEYFGFEESFTVEPSFRNTIRRNISFRARAYTVDIHDSAFAVAYEQALPYTYPVSVHGVLCDSFMLSLEDVSRGAPRRWGSMRVEVQLLLDGRPLSKANAVVNVLSSEHFDRAAAIASSSSSHTSSTSAVAGIRCDYSAELRRCLPGSSVLSPRQYDFIEIGTSGFSTVLELAAGRNNTTGLSVEILKELQDTLPDVPGVVKVNAGIADEAGWRDLYYIPRLTLERLGIVMDIESYSGYLYGMSTVGSYRNFLEHYVRFNGLTPDIAFLASTRRQMVSMKHAGQLLAEYGAASVLYLKVDCEGFDYRIMHAVLDYYDANRDTTQFPLVIQYEDIFSATENGVVSSRLMALGYRVYHVRYGVSNASHSNLDPGTHGEMFAELPDPGEGRADALEGIRYLLPDEFWHHRNACLKYQAVIFLRRQGTAEANATAAAIDVLDPFTTFDGRITDADMKPAGYYCSILVSKDKKIMSVSEKYVVYA